MKAAAPERDCPSVIALRESRRSPRLSVLERFQRLPKTETMEVKNERVPRVEVSSCVRKRTTPSDSRRSKCDSRIAGAKSRVQVHLFIGRWRRSLGFPDLRISTLDDVLIDVRRITDVCELPLIVDADTGFGPSTLNIARTTKSLIKFGAAAMHLEDQVAAKRCGRRQNKQVVPTAEMTDRIKAALDARTDNQFFVIARKPLATLVQAARTITGHKARISFGW
jgi:hypothetical protein